MSDRLVPGLRYPTRAHQLWALVIESFQGWEDRINVAATAAGLTPPSAWALVQIDPHDPISQTKLAARLRCNPSTVVDPTDRLEAAGLVLRKADTADRRVNVLVLTPKGRRVREGLIERLFDPPEAFRRLSATERARFCEVMLAAVTEAEPAAASRELGRR